ncbi:MAG: MFS transporter, partial [Chloroflexi bacterium]|nr:MFS transporter [Chloroflexota bacterium]
LLAALAGLGSGAFHPQGAVLASRAPAKLRGSAMSVFMLGGNTGFAIGPLLGAAAFAVAGAHLPETFAVVGLLQAALIFWVMAGEPDAAAEKSSAPIAGVARVSVSVIATLALVILLRAWVTQSVTTFVPQVIRAQGFSTAVAGNVLFSILLPLAIGGLIGGTLSDRVGRRRVLIVSTALITPALWGLLQMTGAKSFLFGALLGIALGASLPVTLVMAQQLIPRGTGMMSGVVLGFTFIAGALGASVTGIVADQIGLVPTMSINAIFPLGAAALALWLPEDHPARVQEKTGRDASPVN